MTTAPLKRNEAAFGPTCVTVKVRPDAEATPGDLLFDVSCLMGAALAVFETIGDAGDAPETHFAGLYLLRQAYAALNVAQGAPAQRSAA